MCESKGDLLKGEKVAQQKFLGSSSSGNNLIACHWAVINSHCLHNNIDVTHPTIALTRLNANFKLLHKYLILWFSQLQRCCERDAKRWKRRAEKRRVITYATCLLKHLHERMLLNTTRKRFESNFNLRESDFVFSRISYQITSLCEWSLPDMSSEDSVNFHSYSFIPN